ncbi:MAG TPA: TA system VapC family ribonuclease toxin [Lapillicoccus sp.]|nr:TA system VapC family ribonuclease toxin [Lapillicoccus sp.]
MLLLDVNVLIYAFRPEQSDRAQAVRAWLDETMRAERSLAVTADIVAAMIRITTDPRIFDRPAPPGAAVEFGQRLLDAPMCRAVTPSSRHWPIFRELVEDLRLVGNDVANAYLAALAIDHGAAFVTTDRGFRRFPGLRLVDPTA